MNVALQLRTRQQLAMTPELQHSIWLLQLSGVEFEQAVEEALVSNPFLERDDGDEQATPADAAVSSQDYQAGDATTASDADLDAVNTIDQDAMSAPVADDGWESSEWPRASGARDDGEDSDIGSFSPAPVALRDHLLSQVGASRLGDRDRELASLIIYALDADGYLRQTFDDVRDFVLPHADDEELAIALRWVQTLEPAGVGARSTVECLRLQLIQFERESSSSAAESLFAALALAQRMLTDEIDATAGHDTVRLKKAFDCDQSALRAAYAQIQRCNPRPGAAFGVDDTRYVVADLLVRKQGKRWCASVNPAAVPKIHLNHVYAGILQQQRGATASPMGQQLQEARWFVRNVQQRFQTIQRVAQAIVDRQSRFLDYGDVAMKPLVLRDIAKELGLHESTVSRVTSNKYMATPRGLIELKHFFGSHVESAGNACSATAVRALIRQIIADEERANPLSDIKVTKVLSTKGVHVARRTVSKYRDTLQIPPVDARRMAAGA